MWCPIARYPLLQLPCHALMISRWMQVFVMGRMDMTQQALWLLMRDHTCRGLWSSWLFGGAHICGSCCFSCPWQTLMCDPLSNLKPRTVKLAVNAWTLQ